MEKNFSLADVVTSAAGPVDASTSLSTASTVLRSQVISTGHRLFAKNTFEQELFEDFVYADYARLNEERAAILADVADRGAVYGR